jgi:hypothetical protein
MRVNALQRLVIIDSCQAEAARSVDQDLKQIRSIRRPIQETNTSYLLAARVGEAANEADELKHGMLTYLVLRGLSAPSLVEVPGLAPNADGDNDQKITTRELRNYVNLHWPVIKNHVAANQPRGQVLERGPQVPRGSSVDSAGASFELLSLPKTR